MDYWLCIIQTQTHNCALQRANVLHTPPNNSALYSIPALDVTPVRTKTVLLGSTHATVLYQIYLPSKVPSLSAQSRTGINRECCVYPKSNIQSLVNLLGDAFLGAQLVTVRTLT
ncbi:hypothetical protein XELAEV_18000225mg [Xenopus laevis]|uniref:Uncharacterized protein n=1 Tax=Xenopus laevis TaxID=8355 RepID=A0A974GZI4_XENLA|nr:hypothetical protein XELAEV_18000225mg [Xenopus laevis]